MIWRADELTFFAGLKHGDKITLASNDEMLKCTMAHRAYRETRPDCKIIPRLVKWRDRPSDPVIYEVHFVERGRHREPLDFGNGDW